MGNSDGTFKIEADIKDILAKAGIVEKAEQKLGEAAVESANKQVKAQQEVQAELKKTAQLLSDIEKATVKNVSGQKTPKQIERAANQQMLRDARNRMYAEQQELHRLGKLYLKDTYSAVPKYDPFDPVSRDTARWIRAQQLRSDRSDSREMKEALERFRGARGVMDDKKRLYQQDLYSGVRSYDMIDPNDRAAARKQRADELRAERADQREKRDALDRYREAQGVMGDRQRLYQQDLYSGVRSYDMLDPDDRAFARWQRAQQLRAERRRNQSIGQSARISNAVADAMVDVRRDGSAIEEDRNAQMIRDAEERIKNEQRDFANKKRLYQKDLYSGVRTYDPHDPDDRAFARWQRAQEIRNARATQRATATRNKRFFGSEGPIFGSEGLLGSEGVLASGVQRFAGGLGPVAIGAASMYAAKRYVDSIEHNMNRLTERLVEFDTIIQPLAGVGDNALRRPQLAREVMATAAGFGVDVGAVAQARFQIESATADFSKDIGAEALRTGVRFNKLQGSNIEATALAVASGMRVLKDELPATAEGVKALTNKLTYAADVGAFEVDQVAPYLASALGAFKAMGYGGDAGIASILMASQTGMRPETFMTGVRNLPLVMEHAAKKLGHPLTGDFADKMKVVSGLESAETLQLFGRDPFVFAKYISDNTDALRAHIAKLQSLTGATDALGEKLARSLASDPTRPAAEAVRIADATIKNIDPIKMQDASYRLSAVTMKAVEASAKFDQSMITPDWLTDLKKNAAWMTASSFRGGQRMTLLGNWGSSARDKGADLLIKDAEAAGNMEMAGYMKLAMGKYNIKDSTNALVPTGTKEAEEFLAARAAGFTLDADTFAHIKMRTEGGGSEYSGAKWSMMRPFAKGDPAQKQTYLGLVQSGMVGEQSGMVMGSPYLSKITTDREFTQAYAQVTTPGVNDPAGNVTKAEASYLAAVMDKIEKKLTEAADKMSKSAGELNKASEKKRSFRTPFNRE